MPRPGPSRPPSGHRPAWLSLPALLGRIQSLPDVPALHCRKRIRDLLAESHGRGVDGRHHPVIEALAVLHEVRLSIRAQEDRDVAGAVPDDPLERDLLDQEAFHPRLPLPGPTVGADGPEEAHERIAATLRAVDVPAR